MAEIRPFRALRYNLEQAGSIQELTCPPYDIISEEQRREYLSRNGCNIIRLELPKEGENPYEEAARTLRAWREEGILQLDMDPGFYLYEEEFLSQVDISASTLSAVKEGMYNLTTQGSLARYFKDCIVSAGAKTGTAQISEDTTNNGVFVCFAPYEDPEIAVAIVIERGGSGSALASTAVEILNAYFADSDIGTALIPEGSLLP